MKKVYNKPTTVLLHTQIEQPLLKASKVDPDGTTGSDDASNVNKDNTGGNWIDAKRYNAWDTWDE